MYVDLVFAARSKCQLLGVCSKCFGKVMSAYDQLKPLAVLYASWYVVIHILCLMVCVCRSKNTEAIAVYVCGVRLMETKCICCINCGRTMYQNGPLL